MIHHMLRRGKKTTAVGIMYDALDMVQQKTGRHPIEVLEQALRNVGPQMEVRPRRVGGANYKIPFAVKGKRQQNLTIMWFIAAARAKKGMQMSKRIANELVDAYNQTGTAFKKKEDKYKMAEANKAFAHFRW